MRDEIHQLVDQLPEDRLAPVLHLIRDSSRRSDAVATLELVRERLRGVTDGDEALDELRDGDRG